VILLGQAENKVQARELLSRYRAANLNSVLSDSIDGKDFAGRANVPLADDGATHQVLIVLG
jgi:hypothetical protein